MVAGAKACPECRAELGLARKSGLTIYPCPVGHGVGVNLLDARGHFQADELEAIWDGCRHAPISDLPSPITGKMMAEVTFVADDDLQHGNEGRNAFEMTIEVDVENRFGWFQIEELQAMPRHYDTSTGIVGLDALGQGDRRQNAFFSGLTSDDYEGDWAQDDHSSRGFFGGLVRRLKS